MVSKEMGSGKNQYYSLAWGEFGNSLTNAVQLLHKQGDLVDVTLTADGGRKFGAHRLVLSAASPFLFELLKNTPCQHPVVMLAGISADDLEAILEFVYRGQLRVEPSQLPSLLQAAHCLSIHGLTQPTILTEEGKVVPMSSIPGCNDAGISRDAMNAYLPQRRRKKKRKLSGGGGKWPKSGYSLDGRDHSDDRSDYHKDMDDEGEWNTKSKTQSDQPAPCPLCGAVIRQSRNLRRHLELLHFGAGSDKAKKKKKDPSEKKSALSRAPTLLKDYGQPKSEPTNYSTMPSLNLSSSAGSGTSKMNAPGSFLLSGSGGDHPAHHHGHHVPNAHSHSQPNPHPAHHPLTSSATQSMAAAASTSNGIYSSEGASMLSSLFPAIPGLPLTAPHDMFRHSEFFRANMGYPASGQDPSRQQHPSGRHMQRTDAT